MCGYKLTLIYLCAFAGISVVYTYIDIDIYSIIADYGSQKTFVTFFEFLRMQLAVVYVAIN